MITFKDETLSICASPSISSLGHPLVRAFEHQSIGDRQGSCKKRSDGVLFFPRLSVSFYDSLPQVSPRGGCTSLLAGVLTFRKTGGGKTTVIAIHGSAAVSPYTPKKKE